jgi:hypothetical protein
MVPPDDKPCYQAYLLVYYFGISFYLPKPSFKLQVVVF